MREIKNYVFEQYEFKGWLITIENYYGTKNLVGFATPTKYAHLLNSDNYFLSDEIAENQGWKLVEPPDDDDDYYYEGHEDFTWIVAEPDDIVVNFLEDVDTKNVSCVLNYMVKEILRETNKESWGRAFDDIKIVALKQIQKKRPNQKIIKKSRGSLNQAWALLVKERDKRCTECGSVHNLHAHHIKEYINYPELKYDLNNGITLCSICHRKWHKENGRMKRRQLIKEKYGKYKKV